MKSYIETLNDIDGKLNNEKFYVFKREYIDRDIVMASTRQGIAQREIP